MTNTLKPPLEVLQVTYVHNIVSPGRWCLSFSFYAARLVCFITFVFLLFIMSSNQQASYYHSYPVACCYKDPISSKISWIKSNLLFQISDYLSLLAWGQKYIISLSQTLLQCPLLDLSVFGIGHYFCPDWNISTTELSFKRNLHKNIQHSHAAIMTINGNGTVYSL